MCRIFSRIFRDEAGFTAIEYSLIATLSLITTAQLVQLFFLRSLGG